MLNNASAATGLVKHEGALVRRFLAKLLVDVLPAACVSALGGFIMSQYQFTHTAAVHPTVQVVPASSEMMQLVRDEHTAIIDYLRAQTAAEKNRQAAENAADARAVAEARATEVPADSGAAATPSTFTPAEVAAPRPPAPPAAAAVAAKRVTARVRTAAMTMPPHAPLVIARADQAVAPAPVAAEAPREPKSLLTRTIEIKDHVVGATLHVVTAIGGIPSWIASLGDLTGNGEAVPSAPSAASPAARPFFTTSS